MADEFASLRADIEKYSAEVKDLALTTLAKVNKGQEITDELKARIDTAIVEMNANIAPMQERLVALGARLDEVEQKASRRGSGDGYAVPRSIGEVVVADDTVQAALGNPSWKGRFQVKPARADTTTWTAGDTRDVLVPTQRREGIVRIPDRRMTIRDLCMQLRTSSNAIEFTREIGFANNAAVVSEGALKPQTEIQWELELAPVVTIAHWFRASRQILDDAPRLQSEIDQRLRYGLAYAEEVQLLNASGTGNNMTGLVTGAGAFSRTFTPETPTRIDDIRLALLQTQLAELPPSGIVMHPTDWARIETTKDANALYVIRSNQDGLNITSPRMWGLPVVATQAMTVTKFLIGPFSTGAEIYDRMDATVEVSTEDGENFRRNLVTVLCEERLALVVPRPTAFIYGTFQTTT